MVFDEHMYYYSLINIIMLSALCSVSFVLAPTHHVPAYVAIFQKDRGNIIMRTICIISFPAHFLPYVGDSISSETIGVLLRCLLSSKN